MFPGGSELRAFVAPFAIMLSFACCFVEGPMKFQSAHRARTQPLRRSVAGERPQQGFLGTAQGACKGTITPKRGGGTSAAGLPPGLRWGRVRVEPPIVRRFCILCGVFVLPGGGGAIT